MNKIIFIILLFTLTILAQNDTSNTVKYNNISIPDTIDVNVIDNPSFTWLERNEGALLGAIVGLLIAFITIYFSFRSSKKIEMAKQAKADERIKEIYKGYLFAVKAELINHQKLIPLIRQEFEAIIIKSIELKQIILERPTRSIPIKFLTELRIKLLESEIYNTQVFAIFTAYLSKCELINTDTDLTSLITFIENQKEQINFEEALKDYLSTMLKQIDNVIKGGLGLIQYINEDLKKLGVDLEKSEVDYLIRG